MGQTTEVEETKQAEEGAEAVQDESKAEAEVVADDTDAKAGDADPEGDGA